MSQINSNLSAEVYTSLKERIIRWDYPPGHRFTEESLCEEFGVSRSPIREALRMLVENGLVDKEPYRGYSVKQPDLKEIDELYDVRLALEIFVVGQLAAKGIAEDEWKRLHDIWADLLEETPSPNTPFSALDQDFHETLARLTENSTLLQLLVSINERLQFIRMTDITSTERLCATCDQHLAILNSIRSGDVAGAQTAMQMNIEEGRRKVEDAVKEALTRAFLSRGNRTTAVKESSIQS